MFKGMLKSVRKHMQSISFKVLFHLFRFMEMDTWN